MGNSVYFLMNDEIYIEDEIKKEIEYSRKENLNLKVLKIIDEKQYKGHYVDYLQKLIYDNAYIDNDYLRSYDILSFRYLKSKDEETKIAIQFFDGYIDMHLIVINKEYGSNQDICYNLLPRHDDMRYSGIKLSDFV